MGSAFVFLLVAIILVVFNVMQEVMDSLIFSHLHLYLAAMHLSIEHVCLARNYCSPNM